ncbi:MAG: DUF1559 domain-containing protein, partial [Pirellulales bacterium]
RQTQCTGYLKQIGLGIQNFHDIRQEITPSYLTADNSPSAVPTDHATWPILLLPFMEQREIYDLVDLSEPLSSDKAALPANHAAARASSIPTYFCHARRTFSHLTVNNECVVGDYANISRADLGPNVIPSQPRTWDAAMLASQSFNVSPVTTSIPDGGVLKPGEFRAVTKFADILDGLSNTAFISEKAVHQSRLGGDKTNFANTVKAGQQDGTFYYGSGGNPADLIEPGEMAYWSRRLAPALATDRLLPIKPSREDPRNRFGGWHPGVTLFVLGDGSVRAVNNAASSVALQRFGCRNDREEFDLP